MANIFLIVVGLLVLVFTIYSAIAIKHILIYKKINPRVIRLSWVYLIGVGGLLASLLYTITLIDWGSF